MNFGNPDTTQAISSYRALAANYDASCEHVGDIRSETIALLGLRPGDCVLDVGAGTGLSFPLLRAGVGAFGAVIGIELSPEMCRAAHMRIDRHGWDNVRIIENDALRASFGAMRFDALLFHYTHDVLRQPDALANLLACAKPEARVAVAGLKKAAPWLAPLTWFAMWRARKYLTTYEGLEAPWSHLLRWVPDFQRRSTLLGTGYIGWGRVSTPAQPVQSSAGIEAGERTTC